MEKTVKLGDTDYRLHSSLYTIIDYRNVFSTELFKDINKLDNASLKNGEDLTTVIDTIFRIIYVLHRPFSKLSYKDFLMSLDFYILSNQDELQNLTNTIGEMLATFQKGQQARGVPNDTDSKNITANIIFNLAHLGLSIEDTKTFDLNTYFEIIELEMNVISGKQGSRRATQQDIDAYLI